MTAPVLAAIIAALAMPSGAAATPSRYAEAPRELLQRFDTDGSSDVDEAEYLAYLALGFQARDVDGNGVLEGGELPANARPIVRADHDTRLRRQFARQDTNDDGRLDARELLAPPQG